MIDFDAIFGRPQQTEEQLIAQHGQIVFGTTRTLAEMLREAAAQLESMDCRTGDKAIAIGDLKLAASARMLVKNADEGLKELAMRYARVAGGHMKETHEAEAKKRFPMPQSPSNQDGDIEKSDALNH